MACERKLFFAKSIEVDAKSLSFLARCACSATKYESNRSVDIIISFVTDPIVDLLSDIVSSSSKIFAPDKEAFASLLTEYPEKLSNAAGSKIIL